MEPIVIVIVITFLMALVFYAINLHYPHLKKLKYYVTLLLFALGCFGWLAIWLGFGWLTTAVVSTAMLLFSGIGYLIALILDFYDKKKK